MADLQEIVKRNGERIVFCQFEELLKEIPESEKSETGEGEVIIHCPYCKAEGHTKHKLYLNLGKGQGHCFVCGRAYINVDDELDMSFEVPTFESDAFRSRTLQLVPLSGNPDWSLDMYHNEFSEYSEAGARYLAGRTPWMKDLWPLLEFKFIGDNVVIPFKYHSEVFYYQIRFINVGTHEHGRIKYLFPKIQKGCKPPYIIESGDCKRFIICEGVFDAAALLIEAPGFTPFAVLGKCITDYQLAFLREYAPDEILVYMDETKISRDIARKIGSVVDYCPIRVIPSPYGEDPEECLVRRWKTGKKIDWIR